MDIIFPGTYLGLATEFKIGTGVYEEGGKLYAGVTGKASTYKSESGTKEIFIDTSTSEGYVPKIGDIVYALVKDITTLDAKVQIIARENYPLKHGQEYNGIIRYEHMRDYEIDKIVVEECLIPGDIVKAKIVRRRLIV